MSKFNTMTHTDNSIQDGCFACSEESRAGSKCGQRLNRRENLEESESGSADVSFDCDAAAVADKAAHSDRRCCRIDVNETDDSPASPIARRRLHAAPTRVGQAEQLAGA